VLTTVGGAAWRKIFSVVDSSIYTFDGVEIVSWMKAERIEFQVML